MKGKKKGSSLVLVLIFILFFTAISGVVVSAVVSTTKANSSQEVWEDNYYVAEAAIETAVVKASKGEFDTLEYQPLPGQISDPTKTYEKIYDEIDAFDGCSSFINKEVDVKVIKSGDTNAAGNAYINEYYLIQVTAKDIVKGEPRTVKATIAKRMGTGDIFKYMMCGDEVYINNSGSIMSGVVNSANQDPAFIAGATNIYEPPSRVSFTVPDFKFNKITGSKVFSDLSQIDALASDDGRNGVVKLSIHTKNDAGVNTGETIVYLINSDIITINMSIISLYQKIIVCSGDVNLNYVSLNLTNSTIIGKKIVSSPTGTTTLSQPPTGGPHSTFGSDSLKELNEKIAAKCNNWDPSGSTGGSSNYWSTIEYR